MVMQGGILGLEDEESTLYRTVDSIADGVIDRLEGVADAMSDTFGQRMSVAVNATQAAASRASQSSVFAATSGGVVSGGGGIVNNYNTTFNSPKELSWREIKFHEEAQQQKFALLGV